MLQEKIRGKKVHQAFLTRQWLSLFTLFLSKNSTLDSSAKQAEWAEGGQYIQEGWRMDGLDGAQCDINPRVGYLVMSPWFRLYGPGQGACLSWSLGVEV